MKNPLDRAIERVEPLEVQVTSIHDVEGAGLDKQQVQHIDVVHFAVGNVDEGGDRSPQIQHLRIKRFYGTSENAVRMQSGSPSASTCWWRSSRRNFV